MILVVESRGSQVNIINIRKYTHLSYLDLSLCFLIFVPNTAYNCLTYVTLAFHVYD